MAKVKAGMGKAELKNRKPAVNSLGNATRQKTVPG
jgi:hypothetical protein